MGPPHPDRAATKITLESTAITCQFRGLLQRVYLPFPGTIVDNFKFSYQLTTLSKASAIGAAINNFLDPAPRLSSSSIDNYSMGIPSEKLVPKVNLKNNEEARENQTG
jgi:hypothetical protein